MKLKIIQLEEYEEKKVIITKEEWEYLDNNSKYYTFSYIRDISLEKLEVSIKARFFIGLIRICSTLELIIRPKIKAANFIAMLKYVDSKRIKTWNKLVESIKKERNFIDFFMELFLKEVYDLLIFERRRGYNQIIENSNHPKGKISISSTIKSRKFLSNQISCQFFQFSLNTPHNQIIKYTLNYIKKLISAENFSLYRQNLAILKNVRYLKWNTKDIENLTYNRLNYKYKTIHDFCRLILDDFSLKFEIGKEKFFAFVINSWNVYEIFLREIYKIYQTIYKVNAYKIEDLTDDIDWDNKSLVNRRPDIILFKEGKDIIYLDAKYKTQRVLKDYDQMNTYITQLKRLPYGELIYPLINNSQNEEIIGTREKVKIRYIDLEQANDQNYLKDFVSKTIKKYQEISARFNSS